MRSISMRSYQDRFFVDLDAQVYRIEARDQQSGRYVELAFGKTEEGISISYANIRGLLSGGVMRLDLIANRVEGEEGETIEVAGFEGIPLWKRYFRGETVVTPQEPHIYVNRKGFLSIGVRNPTYVDAEERALAFAHEVTGIVFRRSRLEVSFDLLLHDRDDLELAKALIRLDSNDELVEIEAGSLESWVSAGKLQGRAIFKLPFNQQLIPLRYFFYLQFKDSEGGIPLYARLNHLSEDLYHSLQAAFRAPIRSLGDGRVLTLSSHPLSPYFSFLVLPQTSHDRNKTIQSIFAGVARGEAMVRRRLRRPLAPTALIFEKMAATAQDNGYALFLYLAGNPEKAKFTPRFVIDRTSGQRRRLARSPGVISKYSLSFWRLLASESTFTVGSDTRYHLSSVHARPGLLDRYLFVRKNFFLQHGVTGMKRVSFFSPTAAGTGDVTAVASAWEKDIIARSGLDASTIEVTGFARWDRYESDLRWSPAAIQRVLFMPTWRGWLEGLDMDELSTSNYVLAIRAFLQHPLLEETLRQHGAILQFIPHPKLSELSLEMTPPSKVIEIIHQDSVEFSKLIAESQLLITDYSSLLWDYVQLNKSVLRYEFDRERYQGETGGYAHPQMDRVLQRIPTSEGAEGLIAQLTEALRADPVERHHHDASLGRLAFETQDSNNAERICAVINERLEELCRAKPLPHFAEVDRPYRRTTKGLRS